MSDRHGPHTLDALLDDVVAPALARLRQTYRFEGEPGTTLQFVFRDREAFDHYFVLRDDDLDVVPGRSAARDAIDTTLEAYLDFFENRITFPNLVMLGRWRAHGRPADDLYAFLPLHPALTTLTRALPPFPLPDDPAVLTAALEARARALPRLASVDRVRGLDRETFFGRYADRGTPVVITGVTAEWAPFDWSWAGFRSLYEGLPYYVEGLGGLILPSAADLIRQIEENRAGGAAKIGLPVSDALERYYRLPPYFPPERYFRKSQAVLVSAPSLRTPTVWHRDIADNFLLQLIGRKRVEICSPDESGCFYLHSLPPTDANVPFDASAMDPLRPDLEVHPRFRDAHVVDCLLEPGDVLFLPCGWLHTVHQVTPSVSINAWLHHPPAALARRDGSA
ncbi:MAG TPA: cupin-like domain-containing protein [Vicinamibacterales bacterium]|nr:cupin-like domain-containing protein [Vicinamibacterales bacterium]